MPINRSLEIGATSGDPVKISEGDPVKSIFFQVGSHKIGPEAPNAHRGQSTHHDQSQMRRRTATSSPNRLVRCSMMVRQLPP